MTLSESFLMPEPQSKTYRGSPLTSMLTQGVLPP
jgi:hypothetical protein